MEFGRKVVEMREWRGKGKREYVQGLGWSVAGMLLHWLSGWAVSRDVTDKSDIVGEKIPWSHSHFFPKQLTADWSLSLVRSSQLVAAGVGPSGE